MERRAEPELMDDPQQVAAYASADFSQAHEQLLSHLRTLWPDLTPTCAIDLGTGTGDIAMRLARAYPDCHITAVDAGSVMLQQAARVLAQAGLAQRISLVQRHLPDVSGLPRFPLLVSNSLLHHLPDPMILWHTLPRLACPGAVAVIMDLRRPRSMEELEQLVMRHAAGDHPLLQQDFRASLHAAYTCDEVAAQLREAALPLTVHAVGDRHWIAAGRLAHGG